MLPMSLLNSARFWRKVDRRGDNDCWPWIGKRDVQGYGRLAKVKKGEVGVYIASRVAYFLANGEEPKGMVCHTCDNPPCCNPAHLWLGNNRTNQADAALKGRLRGQSKTHCSKGHEFTPENTYWRPGHVASRDCRSCARERAARYLAKRRAA